MPGINTNAVRTAANQLDGAEEMVRGVDLSAVGDVSTALAGGTSAGAASTLASMWATEITALADSIASLAEGYRTTADTWQGTDEDSAVQFVRYGQMQAI